MSFFLYNGIGLYFAPGIPSCIPGFGPTPAGSAATVVVSDTFPTVFHCIIKYAILFYSIIKCDIL